MLYPYKKYKISLALNSSKTQGLRVGDIVQRQYFDNQLQKDENGNYIGKNVGTIYSLMCVLETGEDVVEVEGANGETVQQKQPWFIGMLLDGQAPKTGEILDFVRITSLYDTDRLGALYLTASDYKAPFMDIIDGIGRNESLCWPEDICRTNQPDCETQYYLRGTLTGDYEPIGEAGHKRILHITKTQGGAEFTGLQQDFYKYVSNPNMVLVSYWAKASSTVRASVELRYQIDGQSDGAESCQYDNEWKFYLHPIIVDWSGRHLRTVRLNLGSMHTDDEVWISDFNIILLSSVANFGDASKTRIGRLEGVVDPVFGRLDGYGGYMQKLFASNSAHISGTLTAGDANGFGSSFYAGKIHKNKFVNSLGITTLTGSIRVSEKCPTGVGETLKVTDSTTLVAQTSSWIHGDDTLPTHVGTIQTFSFWAYAKKPCVIDLLQNGQSVGALYINVLQTNQWVRLHKTFEVRPLTQLQQENGEGLYLELAAQFKEVNDDVFGGGFENNQYTSQEDIDADTPSGIMPEINELLISSPQLESGEYPTQYQPTDETLNYTEDYGAWFDRGGIGGTIQNPLLQLNYDGEGGISTRPDADGNASLQLNQDGSGHIAKGRIGWDENGDVTFDKSVRLNWDNLGEDTQHELVSKSIRIVGTDTFTLLGDATGANPTTNPFDITLSIEEENIKSSDKDRLWQYLDGYTWRDFPDGKNNGKTITIFPFNDSPDYWNSANSLTIRCVVKYGGSEYSDTFTIRKQYIAGYTLEITSSNGVGFKNSDCSTILNANVYYQGKLVDPEYCREHYQFRWIKYDMIDGVYIEDEHFWENLDANRDSQQIELNYSISGTDCFTCELTLSPCFPYDFPIYF